MQLKLEEAYKIMHENNGDLKLENTAYTELPDNLIVIGHLSILGSKIKELPENLMVLKCLFMSGNNFKGFPKNCLVASNVYYYEPFTGLNGLLTTEFERNLLIQHNQLKWAYPKRFGVEWYPVSTVVKVKSFTTVRKFILNNWNEEIHYKTSEILDEFNNLLKS